MLGTTRSRFLDLLCERSEIEQEKTGFIWQRPAAARPRWNRDDLFSNLLPVADVLWKFLAPLEATEVQTRESPKTQWCRRLRLGVKRIRP